MDGETREIPVFDVDLDEDPLLRWRSIAAARELGDTESQTSKMEDLESPKNQRFSFKEKIKSTNQLHVLKKCLMLRPMPRCFVNWQMLGSQMLSDCARKHEFCI